MKCKRCDKERQTYAASTPYWWLCFWCFVVERPLRSTVRMVLLRMANRLHERDTKR